MYKLTKRYYLHKELRYGEAMVLHTEFTKFISET